MTGKPGFELRFTIDNAAFSGDAMRPEIARILRAAAVGVLDGRNDAVVRDMNGNRIGSWCIDIDDEG
jgi:hypothetical protein